MTEAVSFVGTYVRRVVDDDLDELFPHLPAILLDGPKGVGKTATAARRCRTVRQLDRGPERGIVAADPFIVRDDPPPVLVDEWQRVPEVLDAIRRLVDEDASGGRFLLTGSAPTRSTHSGAGRVTTVRMRPLALPERTGVTTGVSLGALLSGRAEIGGRCDFGLRDYTDEIVTGGFPGMRHLAGRARASQLDSYLEHIVDHDLPEAGFRVQRPATVAAWLRGYAAAVSTTASWEKIRDAAAAADADKPAKTTTIPYIELLTALRILDPLPAWLPTNSHLSSCTEAPKHHLADPALAARLVRLDATTLLAGAGPGSAVPRDGTYLGALFESLAVLSVRTLAQRHDARVHHLRTRGGRHEVDMIVEGTDGFLAIEVKLSATVDDRDTTHLRWLRQQLPEHCVDLVVLTTGPEAYRRRDGTAVVPLGMLVP
ncbi:MAG: DUF4143 domain-containing protein [Actinomycetota bacterium]|nr:DUF4143 domain-containing protein [Actinomycetota bacterium]